jgi:hypothetical protein
MVRENMLNTFVTDALSDVDGVTLLDVYLHAHDMLILLHPEIEEQDATITTLSAQSTGLYDTYFLQTIEVLREVGISVKGREDE